MSDLLAKARALHRLPAPAMARAIREAAGVSQADVASALTPPVTRAAVSRWESGARRPTGPHLQQYVDLLDELAQLRSGVPS